MGMVVKIPLSQTSEKYAGLYEAIIDDDDAILTETMWSVSIDQRGNANAQNYKGTLSHAVMKRALGRELLPTETVRTKNGNTLDCRRENLYIPLPLKSKPRKIKAIGKNNTTGFAGVSLHKQSGLYTADISHNGKRIRLGYRKTALEAYELRLEAEENGIEAAKEMGRKPSNDKRKYRQETPPQNRYDNFIDWLTTEGGES
jgi:hypothetical protein